MNLTPQNMLLNKSRNDWYESELTYGRVRSQRFVVKTENLSKVVKIGVLDH